MTARAERLGIAAVLFAALVWGTTGTAARLAPDVGPIAIGAAAMGIGGLCQALLARRALVSEWPGLIGLWRLWLVGGLAVALYPLAFYSAMQLAGVTIGTVVTLGTAPLFAALIERRFDGTALSRRWACGAALSVTGLLALALARGAATGPAPLAGIALGLIGGLTYALYSWTARRMMLRGASAKAAMGTTFGLGGLLLLPVLLLTGAAFLEGPRPLAVGLYMALVPMTLGYLAFGYGLARISASMATTLTLLEPVVAALLALWFLGERLSPLGWLGAVLVGAGLLALARAPARSHPA